MADEIENEEIDEIARVLEQNKGKNEVKFKCKHGKHIKVRIEEIPEEAIFNGNVSQ
jgi:proline racemase